MRIAHSHKNPILPEGGSGVKAGPSSAANRLARLPSSFWKGLVLSSSTSTAIAWFSSSRLKKRWFRRRARIQRCTTSTPPSAFALSFGFLGRAGMIAQP